MYSHPKIFHKKCESEMAHLQNPMTAQGLETKEEFPRCRGTTFS